MDTRTLSDEALEALRARAVAMHEAGNAQLSIASALGVHKNTVSRWLKTWRSWGEPGLKRRKRGRRLIEQRRLSEGQETEIRKPITDPCPDQLKLPLALWTRDAVRDLIKGSFGVSLALRTVTDDLKRWCFTPPPLKLMGPMKRATERQDAKIQQWPKRDYPKIARQAKPASRLS